MFFLFNFYRLFSLFIPTFIDLILFPPEHLMQLFGHVSHLFLLQVKMFFWWLDAVPSLMKASCWNTLSVHQAGNKISKSD